MYMRKNNNLFLLTLIIVATAVIAISAFSAAAAMTGAAVDGCRAVPVWSETANTQGDGAKNSVNSSETTGIFDTAASDTIRISNIKSSLSFFSAKEELSVPEIVERVKPSVVGIASVFSEDVKGTGTGIIYSKDGLILTNCHVVQESAHGVITEASDITVVLSDKSEFKAKIIGLDAQTDLAVIKIEPDGKKLTPAVFGNSSKLREGDEAIAIGNPLGFELYGSTTRGIISALGRTITIGDNEMSLIQTDAAINPGNSGGPLVNCYGEVIGINSSKIISVYAEGIGFAIPANAAAPVISDLIKYGYVKGRPNIGITAENVDLTAANFYDVPQGVIVRSIVPGTSAALSELEVGDIIIIIDGEKIRSLSQLNKIKRQYKPGEIMELVVFKTDVCSVCTIDIKLYEQVL
jgi:serine protease Do